MEMNLSSIIGTVVNLVILFAIILLGYKAIQTFKRIVDRNKEMERKIDVILNILVQKEDK